MIRSQGMISPLSTKVVARARRGTPGVLHHDVEIAGLDPAHDGLRIGHLTDLHVGLLTPFAKIRRAIELVDAERPDLLVLTGDYLCYSPKFTPVLRDLLANIHTPIYAVLGNHDHWTDPHGVRKAFEHHGHVLLRNGSSELRLRNAPFTVVGIDDAITGNHDVKKSFSGVRKTGSRLVLTHAPNLADHASSYGHALILAGHTHGGHVHIPHVTAKLMKKFGSNYLKGFYPVNGSLLYVNCGVGSSSIPIRAGAPAEASILTLRGRP